MSLPGNVVVLAGPFNGPDDPDASMQWVDITAYTRSVADIPSVSLGRQTDLDTVDVGQFSMVLNNNDHRFTPGNPTSPYYPGWRTAMRLRMVETVGFRSFVLADGNMLQPSVTIQTPDRIQTVTVAAVDRLGRLQQSRRFISTLAEYIRFNASGLTAFWPLVDATGSRQASEVAGFGQPLTFEGIYVGTAAPVSGFTFGSATGPAGDDGLYPVFSPGLNATSDTVVVGNRLVGRSLGLTVTNPAYGVVAWVKADPTNVGGYQIVLLHDNLAFNVLQISVGLSGNYQFWQLIASTSAGSGAVSGPAVRFGEWQLLGARMTNATGIADFWVDNVFAGTCTTGGAASGALDSIVIQGGSPNTSIGALQLYNGSSFTYSQFVAQYAAGRTGLSGQYTGQRISTVMQYAGISATELSRVDNGTSMMGPARLAGKTALDVAREAEETERGLLHAYGRQLVFHDRHRRYNR